MRYEPKTSFRRNIKPYRYFFWVKGFAKMTGYNIKKTYVKRGLSTVTTATSISFGLKSTESTDIKQLMAVCNSNNNNKKQSKIPGIQFY